MNLTHRLCIHKRTRQETTTVFYQLFILITYGLCYDCTSCPNVHAMFSCSLVIRLMSYYSSTMRLPQDQHAIYTYKLFSANLLTISSTSSSYSSSPSVLIITSSIKLTTFPVLIIFHRISYIMVWNITSEFINLKNITVGSNDPSRVVNAAFHSSPSFILILLYPHLRSIFVNTFLVLMFSTMSKIKDKG